MALYLIPKGWPEHSVHDSRIEIPNNLPKDIQYFYGAVFKERDRDIIRTIHKRALALFSWDKDISTVREKLQSVARDSIRGDLTFSDEIGKNM